MHDRRGFRGGGCMMTKMSTSRYCHFVPAQEPGVKPKRGADFVLSHLNYFFESLLYMALRFLVLKCTIYGRRLQANVDKCGRNGQIDR